MDIRDIIIIITAVSSLTLGVLVLSRDTHRRLNRFFFGITLSLILWCVSIVVYRNVESVSASITWAKILYFSAVWIPLFNLLFVYEFLKGKKYLSLLRWIILLSPAIAVTIMSLSPLLVVSNILIRSGFEKEIIFGPAYYTFYIIYIISYFLWSYYLLFRGLISSEGIKKAQILIVFIGLISASSIGMISNLTLPTIKIFTFNWLGQVVTALYLTAMAYAITRYRLMDIRLIIARTLVFGLIVLLITSIYATLSAIIATFFEAWIGIRSNIIIGIIVAVLVVSGYQPIRKLIEKITEKFLFKKTYDPDTLLAEISKVTSSILDLKHLLASISKTLHDAIHVQEIGVALLNKENKLEILYNEGLTKEDADQLANYPNVINILQKELKNVDGIFVIDEMKTRYENGEFKPVDPILLMALYEKDIALIIPLFAQEKLIGVLSLGNKKSGEPYNNQDLSVLKIIAGQAAIAIENARLYEELKLFNVKLEEEVRRKTYELRQANVELKQLDQAKSEFISIASHQLRTPLTVIKGYISMMKEGSFGKVPEVIMENLDKVYISNERLITLVEDLLNISRIESGRQEFLWKQINMEDLAKTVVENLKQTAKRKDLKLFFHSPGKTTPKVTADEGKIHEVMMNFVDNAIKYTDEGEINVYINYEPQKEAVTFCVKDTGKGISKDGLQMLFKKFSRGKGSFRAHTEGLGLGLYVAKMMLDSHQGKIWAESDGEGKGSKFCFSLSTKLTQKELEKVLPGKKFGEKVKAKKASGVKSGK